MNHKNDLRAGVSCAPVSWTWLVKFGHIPAPGDLIEFIYKKAMYSGEMFSAPQYDGSVAVKGGDNTLHTVYACDAISITTLDGTIYVRGDGARLKRMKELGYPVMEERLMHFDYPSFNQNCVDVSKPFWVIFCPTCNNVTLAQDEALAKAKAEELTEKSGNPHIIFEQKGICKPTRNVAWS